MFCANLTCEGSGEWGLNVIRTIWLGFAFLIVLAGVASFRFAFGHFDTANASGIVRADVDRAVGKMAAQEAFTNIERLRVAYVPYAPDAVESEKAEQISAGLRSRTTQMMVTPRLISRNRCDHASRVICQTGDQKSKRNNAKIDVGATKNRSAAEPKSCQLEDFDAVRWAFNLPTGCRTQLYPSKGA